MFKVSTIFFCAATLILSSCSKEREQDYSSVAGASSFGDSFIESSIGDASYLNPVLATDTSSSDINGLVFNGLVKYDENLELKGDLAKSWNVSKDGRVFTFYLRQNVRWHDGQIFTADDVLYTYQRLVDPKVKTPYGSNFASVIKIEKLDNFTVQVTYKEAFVPALESWGIGIVAKHVFGGATGQEFNQHSANKNPIGTGPYKFKEWKTDEKIVLVANPDYFNGKPHIAQYIYRIIPDNSVEFLELRNESIDTMDLTPDQYRAYPEFFRNYKKYRVPRAAYTYMAFNLKNPLFKEHALRLAIAHAINKQELVQGVLLGMGQLATGPFFPLSWAYDETVEDFKFDPKKAKEILKQQGWQDSNGDGILDKNGKDFSFVLATNQGNSMRALSAEIIQQQLLNVGIKMEIRMVEWSTFIKRYVDEQNFDAIILGWTISPDPDVYSIWHSSQKEKGQYNFVHYKNEEVDKILEQGRIEFNAEKRKNLYRKMHHLVHDDLPYIFLYYPESLPVVHKRFVGPQIKPVSSFGFAWNFDQWYVPKNWIKYPVKPALEK